VIAQGDQELLLRLTGQRAGEENIEYRVSHSQHREREIKRFRERQSCWLLERRRSLGGKPFTPSPR